jgi:hypothetical protein
MDPYLPYQIELVKIVDRLAPQAGNNAGSARFPPPGRDSGDERAHERQFSGGG